VTSSVATVTTMGTVQIPAPIRTRIHENPGSEKPNIMTHSRLKHYMQQT